MIIAKQHKQKRTLKRRKSDGLRCLSFTIACSNTKTYCFELEPQKFLGTQTCLRGWAITHKQGVELKND
jgi:hypothetical protein